MNNAFKPIEWTDEMSTGLPEIDKQHRFLVDTLQKANIILLQNIDQEQIQQIVNNMLYFAITHFDTEESLMHQYGYEVSCPEEAREHIAQHREFSRQVVEVIDLLREGQEISHLDVPKFINHWLIDHVQVNDQLLASFIHKAMQHSATNTDN